MAAIKLEELRRDVEELNKFLSQAERSKVKDMLLINIRRIETEITNLRQKAEEETAGASAKPVVSTQPKCYEVKLNNYAWDQSDKFVKIFITLKNVQTLEEANVFCNFANRTVEFNAKGLDNRNYLLSIKNLLEDIDIEKSYWKVKTDNVVIFMAKKKAGSQWSHMTSAEKKAVESKLPKMGETKDDPTAGLMDMMKQMYDDGDDEMKRTIAKAWTESRDKQTPGAGPMGMGTGMDSTFGF